MAPTPVHSDTPKTPALRRSSVRVQAMKENTERRQINESKAMQNEEEKLSNEREKDHSGQNQDEKKKIRR